MPRVAPFDAFFRGNRNRSPLREQDNRIPNLVDCERRAHGAHSDYHRGRRGGPTDIT
jgi:hypothetical protein